MNSTNSGILLDENKMLRVHIKNQAPIELIDFTNTMNALALEYSNFALKGYEKFPEYTKLYIKEIRQGSTIADLAPILGVALPFIESANATFEFLEYFKRIINFYLGKNSEKPQINKTNLYNIGKIIEPVAKDHGSQLIMDNIQNNGTINIFTLNSEEASKSLRKIQQEIGAPRLTSIPTLSFYDDVPLYFNSASASLKSTSHDYGIIDKIAKRKQIKIKFVHERDKKRIISGDHNIFNKIYIVDVEVEFADDKPCLYKILEIKDELDREH